MSRPSGDQRGKPGSLANEVSWTAWDPSGSASQISDSPVRFDKNARRCPLGETLAMESLCVDATATTGGPKAGAPGAEGSTRQMFVWTTLRT
jgi:hypothetical protein